MYLLDENITKDQRELLKKWRFRVKQVGIDFENKGIKDEQIITLLQQIKGVLFITRDIDFSKKNFVISIIVLCFLMSKKMKWLITSGNF